jgi:DNA ligase 1
MQVFADLFVGLDASTSTQAKVQALQQYFSDQPPADVAWAVYLLAGGKLKQLIPTRVLRETAQKLANIEPWLFDECYQVVGDLAETIAHVLPPASSTSDLSLDAWMQRLGELRGKGVAEQTLALQQAWQGLSNAQRFVFNKLITGGFRVGVSKALVQRALAQAFGLDSKVLAQRMMGYLDAKQQPSATRLSIMLNPEQAEQDSGAPYPFFLAHPLPDIKLLGESIDQWQLEWKWDGIRCQIVLRAGQLFLWSRGEELITEKFPELLPLKDHLPQGTVLDGELLVWDHAGNKPAGFASLQTRLNRKLVGKKLMQQNPVLFMAYDLLEHQGVDIRSQPLEQRRRMLSAVLESPPESLLRLSEPVSVHTWDQAAVLRASSRSLGVEGFMLKHKQSAYGIARHKSPEGYDWWKWKTDPLSIDAVLVYAQRGHGRRANLYTDYTFALWNAPLGGQRELVPFAKAYSGLTDEEIRQVDTVIRKTTREKFGPVRSVEPSLVFELGFEAISQSARHKSGLAVRFPRILRPRPDKTIDQADLLSDLLKLTG